MNITIVGAGNIGTQLAVHCAEKDIKLLFMDLNQKKFRIQCILLMRMTK